MSKLTVDDGRAIDVILMNGQGKTGVSAAADEAISGRISAAAKILGLLDTMPADEPSRDLTRRTIERINQIPGAAHDVPPGTDATGESPTA